MELCIKYFAIMKKSLISLLAACLPLISYGQAQITTKKVKLEDFPEKTTKIVLSGNPFLDESLKEEIRSRWTISPFEFCSLEEYESIKSDDSYYFLLTVKGQFRKESEPGIEMLSLVKGGKGADKGLDDMLEVVTLPFRPADFPSGRELVFLPAFIDIIQAHVLASMEKDINAYTGLSNYTINLGKSKSFDVIFSSDDLSGQITPQVRNLYFGSSTKMQEVEEDEADEYLMNGTPNTLVSYTVCPSEPVNGSFCYKMLIDCHTHELYYFRKHRINKKAGKGFLLEDVKRVAQR